MANHSELFFCSNLSPFQIVFKILQLQIDSVAAHQNSIVQSNYSPEHIGRSYRDELEEIGIQIISTTIVFNIRYLLLRDTKVVAKLRKMSDIHHLQAVKNLHFRTYWQHSVCNVLQIHNQKELIPLHFMYLILIHISQQEMR